MAIVWNENPSPRETTLEDGTVVTRACAWTPPGCHSVGCGVRLFVKDGELQKIEGDPEHPITRGRLCPRCLAFKEVVYHKDRILHPMKRAREDRGRDKWEQITWDEAYEIIAQKTAEIKEKYGPEAIIVYGGTGRESVRFQYMLASQVLGTPNVCYAQSGWSCRGPRQTALNMLLGASYIELDWGGEYAHQWEDPDFVRPDYIFNIGKDALRSNPDGLWGHAIVELMKRGTKMINVDPRMNWLSARSDLVLQVRPNTDGALVLALLNIIINEDLVDHDFIDRWCYGYAELAERVQEYTPAWAAEECGIAEEDIVKCAHLIGYDGVHHWSLCMGVATDQNPNGCQLVQGLVALVAITGNLDVPGGTSIGSQMKFDMNASSPLPDELVDKTIGWKEYPILPQLLNTTHPDLTLDTLETDKPYPVRMAWLDSTNLLSPTCSAQPRRWHDALLRMEFTVAKELFMTPTVMALADLVLPLATWAEHDGFVTCGGGSEVGTIGLINEAFHYGEGKSDLQINIELGKIMNPGFRFNDVYEYLDGRLQGIGTSWEEVRQNVSGIQNCDGFYKYERGLLRADGQVGFQTTTGRVELWAVGYARLDDDPLPYYEHPRLISEDIKKEYPLIVTTGARYYASFHSEHRQIPSLRQLTPDPLVEIHPDTAAELGIKDGDAVIIENPWGKVREIARVAPVVRRDTVAAAHGWWYPEEDGEEPHLFGVWKSNVNSLIPHKIIGKMGFGAPYKCLPCKVYKATDAE